MGPESDNNIKTLLGAMIYSYGNLELVIKYILKENRYISLMN